VNLLFLTPQLPHPPRQGTAIRNWGLIEHLARRHAVTLASFADEGQSVTPELRAACREIVVVPAPRRSRADRLRTLLSPQADLARRLWSPVMERALRDLLAARAFEVVQIEGLEMAPYLTAAPGRAGRVYDAHNAEYLIQQRALGVDWRRPGRWPAALYSALQLPRLRRFEAQTCRAVDAVTCVSEADARALRGLAATVTPAVVPNGIDLSAYQLTARPAAPAQIVFTGKMDYRPNLDAALWFALEIFPRIRARRPEAQFIVVGQKPGAALRRLDGRAGVVVTGTVDDARPYIAAGTVYVAPLRMGGGTRFKLLEAMALGRPIVSTPVGAEGFAVRSGRDLLLAESGAGFAEAVLGLLADEARAAALGAAGREFAQAYDWSAIVPRLEEIYARLSARGS
jgi:sugar transferase (PEP-CTERM/EpsH1 system associated)